MERNSIDTEDQKVWMSALCQKQPIRLSDAKGAKLIDQLYRALICSWKEIELKDHESVLSSQNELEPIT